MKTKLAAAVASLLVSSLAGADPAYVYNPFQLAFASYRGKLKEQGIPAYGVFCSKFRSGPDGLVSDIMDAALEAELIDQPSFDDEGYRNALDLQVRSICTSR